MIARLCTFCRTDLNSLHPGANIAIHQDGRCRVARPGTADLQELCERVTTLTVSIAALNANHKGLTEKLDVVLELQGKLMARLDAMDKGLHETAMRNHAQFHEWLKASRLKKPCP